jgi:hypothetical protein
VHLYTDQTQVLFHAQDGTCYSNGAVVACPTSGPCSQPGRFCGPIKIISNYPAPLSAVVLQLAQAADGNQIEGCADETPDTTGGLCALGQNSVDVADSNLSSPIQPSDPGLQPCSYCVGNAFVAAGMAGFEGLAATLPPGLDPALGTANTVLVELELEADDDLGVDISLRAAQPAFAAMPNDVALVSPQGKNCASLGDGSRVLVRGHGFGAPAPCWASPLASCPASGAAPSGHLVRLGSAGLTAVSWADDAVLATLSGTASNRLQIVTPSATITSSDYAPFCASGLVINVPPTAGPRQGIALSGSGFASGEFVVLFVDEIQAGTTSASGGAFNLPTFTLPALSNGTHSIAAIGQASGHYIRRNIDITGSLTATPINHSAFWLQGVGFVPGVQGVVVVDGTSLFSYTPSASSFGVNVSGYALTTSPVMTVEFNQSSPGVNRRVEVERLPVVFNAAPATAVAGRTMNVTASGFAASESVTLYLDDMTSLASAPASGSGAVSFLSVPLHAATMPGAHKLLVVGSSSGRRASRDLTVTVSTLTVTPPSGPAGTSVTISGGGFNPGENVVITDESGTSFGAVASSSGGFTVSRPVPTTSSSTEHFSGSVRYSASGFSSGFTAAGYFTRTTGATVISTFTGGPPGMALSNVTATGFAAGETVRVYTPGNPARNVTANPAGAVTISNVVVDATINGPVDVIVEGLGSGTFTKRPYVVGGALTLTPSSGPVGTPISVSGNGFAPGQLVMLTWSGGSTTVPANGVGAFVFNTSVNVPPNISTFSLTATQSSGGTRTAYFAVSGRPQGTVSLSPSAGGPTSRPRFVLSGFQPGEVVDVYYGGRLFGSSTVDSAGALSFFQALPLRAPGSYPVIVRGRTSARLGQATFTVAHGSLSVDKTAVAAGGSFTVSGTGFTPSMSVTFRVLTTVLGSVTPDATGAFSTTLTMPAGPAADVLLYGASGRGDYGSIVMRRQPAVTASPTSIGPQGAVTFNVTSFQNETVDVYHQHVLVGSFVATNGAGSHTVSLRRMPDGPTTLSLRGRASGAIVEVPVQVSSSLSASPSETRGGDAFALNGSGFLPGETVNIHVAGLLQPAQLADGAGALNASLTMPVGVASSINVTAQGVTSGVRMTVAVRRRAWVAVTPGSRGPGAAVTVTGGGFSSTENVALDVDGLTGTNIAADAFGNLSAVRSLPAFANGTHVVRLRGLSSRLVASTGFDIVGSAIATPNGGPGGTVLPVSASGFAPSEPVQVVYGATLLVTLTSNASGDLAGNVTVPSGQRGAIGLRLTGQVSGVRRTLQLVRP